MPVRDSGGWFLRLWGLLSETLGAGFLDSGGWFLGGAGERRGPLTARLHTKSLQTAVR